MLINGWLWLGLRVEARLYGVCLQLEAQGLGFRARVCLGFRV